MNKMIYIKTHLIIIDGSIEIISITGKTATNNIPTSIHTG